MSVEFFLLGLLSILLIGSNVFWAKMVFRMSDRLMSRNYFEFTQVEKLKSARPKPETKTEDYMIDPEDERQARELNSMFNIA